MRRGSACGDAAGGPDAGSAQGEDDDGKVFAIYSLDVSDAF